MNGWHVIANQEWHCWICGTKTNTQFWAHEQAAKAYSICNKCEDGFLKVVVKRGIK